jgi:hypothetical protein
MMRINLIAISLLVCSHFASRASSAAQDVKIAVKFDQSFYDLELTDKHFLFREGSITYRSKVMTCNRSALSKKRDEFNSLSKNYFSSPTEKSEFDVQFTDRDGKAFSVARGSTFGTWLRELPKTMMYFNAEVKASCKR